ncbi:hypothetical protein PFNF54_04296, partial [Plasmodium falciparum NF54]
KIIYRLQESISELLVISKCKKCKTELYPFLKFVNDL